MKPLGKPRKICLAYSGGLDTSIIMPWLKENFDNPEIIAVCVNVGQQEDWEAVQRKAYASGASKYFFSGLPGGICVGISLSHGKSRGCL